MHSPIPQQNFLTRPLQPTLQDFLLQHTFSPLQYSNPNFYPFSPQPYLNHSQLQKRANPYQTYDLTTYMPDPQKWIKSHQEYLEIPNLLANYQTRTLNGEPFPGKLDNKARRANINLEKDYGNHHVFIRENRSVPEAYNNRSPLFTQNRGSEDYSMPYGRDLSAPVSSLSRMNIFNQVSVNTNIQNFTSGQNYNLNHNSSNRLSVDYDVSPCQYNQLCNQVKSDVEVITIDDDSDDNETRIPEESNRSMVASQDRGDNDESWEIIRHEYPELPSSLAQDVENLGTEGSKPVSGYQINIENQLSHHKVEEISLISGSPEGKTHQESNETLKGALGSRKPYAKVPSFCLNDKKRQVSRRSVKCVWDPSCVKRKELEKFIEDLSKVIRKDISDEETALRTLKDFNMDRESMLAAAKRNKASYRDKFEVKDRSLKM